MSNSDLTIQPAYGLGTFSIAGSPPFAGLMIQQQVLAIRALQPAAQALGLSLINPDDLLSVLDHWALNSDTLESLAQRVIAEGWESIQLTDRPVPLELLTVHAPLTPRQYFCSGANYRQHVIDLVIDQRRDPEWKHLNDEDIRVQAEAFVERRAQSTPYVFSKVASSLAGPYDDIQIAEYDLLPDWEAELGVIIGKEAFQLTEDNAMDAVAGYTIVNDITNRELTHRPDLKAIGSDWLMGKCQPGYSPMGPWLVPKSQIKDPHNLRIQLRLNDDLMQDETSADMIFNIPQLLVYLSSRIRLMPGDLLITGSPAGNGSHYQRFLKSGDRIQTCIEGLGQQENWCVGQE